MLSKEDVHGFLMAKLFFSKGGIIYVLGNSLNAVKTLFKYFTPQREDYLTAKRILSFFMFDFV